MPCWQAIILDHMGVDNYHGLTCGMIRLDRGESLPSIVCAILDCSSNLGRSSVTQFAYE